MEAVGLESLGRVRLCVSIFGVVLWGRRWK